MRALWLVLPLTVACSEYDLVTSEKPGRPGEDEGSDATGGESDGGGGDGADGVDGGETTTDGCDLDLPGAIDVALNEVCDVPYSPGTFTPVVEWQLPGYNAYGPPSAANLNDDNGDGVIGDGDTPDIIWSTNTSQGLISVNGATGAVQWINPFVSDFASGTAVGDLDGDGVPEIVATNSTTQVVVLDNMGNELWTASVDPGGTDWFSYPSIADLDADGIPEVIVGRNIFDNNGNRVGTGAYGTGGCRNEGYTDYVEGSISVAVDLNGDGELEVVVGNAAYRKDGSALWYNGMSDGIPAVADMDLDGEPEIVVIGGNRVWTLETDGTPTGWVASFSGTNYLGPPAIDDLDGDGAPEMVIVGSSEMRAYRWDGSVLWTRPVYDASGAAGVVLFDFELDGYPEVVYADERTVRVFNGLDGSVKLESSDHSSYTGFENPIVADVDGDGEVEIAMLHGNGSYGLTVYGDADHSWPAGRKIWNQHAYTITNVEDDGGIPAVQPPNWDVYNNFRSADAGLPPSEWQDLRPEVVEVCTKECPEKLMMTVRVWNQGTGPVDAGVVVVVRAGEGGPIVASATVPVEIPSARSSDGVLLTVDVNDLGGATPIVGFDDSVAPVSLILDCATDNDTSGLSSTCG
jgi:hypothetical protein